MNPQEYKEGLEILLAEKSREKVGNMQPIHEAACYELFFKKAKEIVRVFSDKNLNYVFSTEGINPGISPYASLHEALSRFVRVRFLVNAEIGAKSEFLNKAVDYGYPSLHVAYFDMNDVGGEKMAKSFMVMDKTAYRFEDAKDERNCFVRMYHPEEAKKLISAFDRKWNSSKILNLERARS